MKLIELAERRWLPDWLIRRGIRRMLAQRLIQESRKSVHDRRQALDGFVDMLKASPIAIDTQAANEQHYELPSEFFWTVLGPQLKYSCGYWPAASRTSLEGSELEMLSLTAERAEIADGMRILELGCGWGSFSLFAATRFPNSQIVGISNSNRQRESIMASAQARGLTNLEIRTADVRDLELQETFDRVVSIEMFEHMRNYQELMRRIAGWLSPSGKLFVHIFCHRELAYPFQVGESGDWMARKFFTGGIMPSADLLTHFQDDLRLEQTWATNGQHYARTCEAWLQNMDANAEAIGKLFRSDLGPAQASIQQQRWRMFFMACAELFTFRQGTEWYVSHYRFANSQSPPAW